MIVTATRRETCIVETPLAISAVTQEELTRYGITNIKDLSYSLPGLAIQNSDTNAPIITLRGIRSNNVTEVGDPAVGVHVDGLYQSRPQGAQALMFDLERAELARGPQGTLFGRNVTAGAVLITTGSPTDEFTSKARVAMDGIGSPGGGLNKYIQYRVGGPIADGWKGSFSAHLNRDSGWFKNDFTDDEHGMNNQESFRATLIHDYSDRTTFTFKTESSDRRP